MANINVRPEDLNYNRYTAEQYDRDIVNSIPFHKEIHRLIGEFLYTWAVNNTRSPVVIDLGVGTGLTSRLVKTGLPKANLTVVDFSVQMLNGALQKLGSKGVQYIQDDYSTVPLVEGRYDIVMSVIGLHHQPDESKRAMFQKIHRALRQGGVFIFGDLVTFRDSNKTALATAHHYHHLVENAADEQALTEWSHQHLFLNQLAPLEDQLDWLKEAGFTDVQVLFQQFATALIIAR